MNEHEKINYVEYPAKDIGATKRFFETAFGWVFADYGPDYAAFSNQGLDGGFYQSDLASDSVKGAALIVFYSQNRVGLSAKRYFYFPGVAAFISPSPVEMSLRCGQIWVGNPPMHAEMDNSPKAGVANEGTRLSASLRV